MRGLRTTHGLHVDADCRIADCSRGGQHLHHPSQAVSEGSHTTGATFSGLTDLVDSMDPPARLVVLENVPSLQDKCKRTKRSGFDAAQDAFRSRGYGFVSKVFDATETGIPNRRSRLYMAAVHPGAGGLPPAGGLPRALATLDRVLRASKQRPLDDFLLEEGSPGELTASWKPRGTRPTARPAALQLDAVVAANAELWAKAAHPEDKGKYMEQLSKNAAYTCLTARQQDCSAHAGARARPCACS